MTRETRKIQKVGGSTFSVSLPKSWARARDLEAGSLVTVYAHPDDVLVVQPGEDAETIERRIRVEHDDPDRLVHVVRAAYAAGIDELELEATETLTRRQRRAVGRVTDDLPGTAVVEEREDRMVLRVLLDGEEVSVEQSVRQLAFVAASVHREAMAALAGSASPGSVDRDADAERLLALVDRHVQRGLSRVVTLDALDASRPELVDLRATARELERVTTDARRLCDRMEARTEESTDVGVGDDGSQPPSTETAPADSDGAFESAPPRLVELGERACEIVEAATDAVVTDAGADAARAVLAERRALDEELASFEREHREHSGEYPLDRALEHCRRTADRGAAIAELALRGSLRRDDLIVGAVEPDSTIEGLDGLDAPAGNGSGVATAEVPEGLASDGSEPATTDETATADETATTDDTAAVDLPDELPDGDACEAATDGED